MVYKNSNWTGRTPRNMNEAFGEGATLTKDGDSLRAANRVIIVTAIITFLLALALVLCPNRAHADTLPPAPSDPLVQKWYAANDHCRGDQIAPDRNPQCAYRAQVAQVLLGAGYSQSTTDVWVGPLTLHQFIDIMSVANGMDDYSMVGFLQQELTQRVSLRMQFAIWNLPGGPAIIGKQLPNAFAIWAKMMRDMEAAHAGDNDPTLRLNDAY